MTDNKRLRQLFDVVIAAPADRRAEVAARACGDDDALRRRVLNMVAAAEDEQFLVDPTADAATVEPTSTPERTGPDEHAGDLIGPYKLLQQIGEGGFGVVWMAEQREPVKRRVALKIIKLGMDTKQVIARFMAERQALAMMDHPNIAKVFDAGSTDTGRPYFVMEYIKGVPVTEYCDGARLGTDGRLALFQKVCHAIQHAHQKGIIHRDIKPSNVLVTLHDGVPVPKVIDFGVAKATNNELTTQTLFTEHRQMIGTPTYMSPEQAEMSGLDIDTRADVYSLGVLLYELLTGTTPFDIQSLLQAGYAEMMRVIREQEPKRPSTRFSTLDDTATRSAQLRHSDARRLGQSLRGDLDWIVMKCLEKDRTRRYETANGLAEDIGRHLAHEPITASPPSAAYRLRKFVRRNRAGVTAGAVVLLLLLGGIAGTAYGLVRAQVERDEATRQSEIAEAVNDFLNNDLLAAVAPSTEQGKGVDVSMREVLMEASKRIDDASRPGGRLADKPAVEEAIRWTLYDTLDQIGEWNVMTPHARRLVELRTRLWGAEHEKTVAAQRCVGLCLLRTGKYQECVDFHRKLLPVIERVSGEAATFFPKMNMAVSLAQVGETEETIRIYQDVVARSEALLGRDDRTTSHAMRDLGQFLVRAGRLDEALRLLRDALQIHQTAYGSENYETISSQVALGGALSRKADTLPEGDARTELLRESRGLLEQAVRFGRRFLGDTHPAVNGASTRLWIAYDQLRHDPATREAVRSQIELAQAANAPATWKNEVSWYLLNDDPLTSEDLELALQFATDAAAKVEAGDDSIALCHVLDTLALAQQRVGDSAAAVATQRRAIELLPDGSDRLESYGRRLAEYEAAVQKGDGK